MAENFNALKVALETDARYDADVRNGHNATLVNLLNTLEPLQTVITDISRQDAVKAFRDEIRTLTAQQLQRLRLLVDSESSSVRTSDSDVRAELGDIFGGGSNPAIVRLATAATRDATYGDAFGYSQVSLDTVRKAVRLISKSFIVSTGQV
jgi:hypothetical protein